MNRDIKLASLNKLLNYIPDETDLYIETQSDVTATELLGQLSASSSGCSGGDGISSKWGQEGSVSQGM